MRILYLSQYFPPEVGATQGRALDMARHLVEAGHQVTVLTEMPNHPSGVVPREYRGKFLDRTSMGGIEVVRVWIRASPAKTFRTRMAFYLSYMVNAALTGLFRLKGPYDLIYASSPPLFVGAAGLIIAVSRKIPLVFEVRDLWPESAVALGEIAHPALIGLATRLEEACYRRAERIVVVTPGMWGRLVKRRIPEQKLALIPNGANLDLFCYHPAARQRIRAELGIEKSFVAIYAGVHGLAQGLETLVEAARMLADDPSIHLLMLGEGPKKPDLMALKAGYSLSNITFIAEKPRENMAEWLSAADVALIPLRRREIFKGALPTKLFEAWACERPVILGVDGDARRMLGQARGGIYVEPENPPALVAALCFLRENEEARRAMGTNGRQFTAAHYSRDAQGRQLASLLESIRNSRRHARV